MGGRSEQDLYSLFIRKMQDAPPQEVTIVGDDWEEQREDEGGGAPKFFHLIPCDQRNGKM